MGQKNFSIKMPKFEQPKQQSLYTPTSKSQTKKPVFLFSWNTMINTIKKELTEEEWEKYVNIDIKEDVLDKAFEEADKEDLYGNPCNEKCGDGILNENEQKNFMAGLIGLKETFPKLYEVVNKFVENIQAKADCEKIASNLYLKVADNLGRATDSKEIMGYAIRDLNNENLMAVSKEYKGFSLLYELYVEAKERADAELPDEEFKPDEWFSEDEKRTAEKMKEYQEKHERYRNEEIQNKERAEKDLETIKEKAIDYSNYIIQLATKNNIYSKDYEKELANAIEKNDIKNLAIITQRLSDRVFMEKDKEEKTVNASKRAIELKEANGQIDTTFVQGYTGDCWFLSALKSLCTDKEVLERINNMITLNKENGITKSITVNIQGKEYTFDYENIKGANEYSTGDLDVRALEMAVNQFVHDKDLLNGDVTLGGWEKDAYTILLGEDNIEVAEYQVDGDAWAFDSEKYLKTLKENSGKIISNLSIYPYLDWRDKPEKLYAEDKDGVQVELHLQHAYNYTRIDEKYFYFTDPHAPEKELKIPQNQVGKVFDAASTVKFKDSSKDQASL